MLIHKKLERMWRGRVFVTSFEVLYGHLTGEFPNYVYTSKLNYVDVSVTVHH